MTDYRGYSEVITAKLAETETTGIAGAVSSEAMERVQHYMQRTHRLGGRIIFVGNGGSAAIASHCAIDYLKNGGLRAMAFNDSAALTCLGNDLGYEKVFSSQIEMHARLGDMLVAISSSGSSPNILHAAAMMWDMNNLVVTLSGFRPTNRLRSMGHVNFYVPSDKYGVVEIAHLTILHAILDLMPLYSK